jgi:hypothetical protein
MKQPKAKFIISRYKEDFSWVNEYTNDYIVYNKGDELPQDGYVWNVPNYGGNQIDIFRFIHDNYYNLPDLMAFLQANPWDHCKKETFDKIIYNEKFTSIEDYGMTPANGFEGRTPEGGFLEINNSWYISAHNGTWGLTCKYQSFDEFMDKYFSDYEHVELIRFAPGSQYIVEKQQVLKYPLVFWGSMIGELPENNMTEAHIVERALWYILTGKYELRKDFYGK